MIENLKFRVIKTSPRPKPGKENIIILPMFSEFGCETLAVLYCIPKMLRERYQGKYVIAMGWHGREFFYRHLVDEYWELDKKHQWLRTYCRAFHHDSKNLTKFERKAKDYGNVVNIGEIAGEAVYPLLDKCPACGGKITQRKTQHCEKCRRVYGQPGFFNNLRGAKKDVCWTPEPSEEAFSRVKDFLPEKAVGITARNRKTYGRNLPVIFYERLIHLVEDCGYNPVWLGERATTHPCPYKRIPDFSSSELSDDLENTLALVSKLNFTVQLYTASSRLAAMVGTPYIIVESPDQIWGVGQEGIRLNLMSKNNKRKLIACQFLDSFNKQDELLKLIENGIEDIEKEDYSDIMGLMSSKVLGKFLQNVNADRIGEFLRNE